jgi:uncharacterized protein DUF3176
MDENYSHEQGALRAEQERLLPENEIELQVRPSQEDLDPSGLVEQLPADPDISTPVSYTSDHHEQHEVSSGAALPGEASENESTVPAPQSDIHPQNNVGPSGSGITSPLIREKSLEKSWRRLLRINIREWFGELMACMVFVSFLLGTFLFLRSRDGKPLPKYSLNALLSVFGVMLEGSLAYIVGATISQNQWRWLKSTQKERKLSDIVRYDEAAREPLGAMKYFFDIHRFRREPITALAAVVLISTLLIDPFIQQLLNFANCSTNLTESATIPRTSYYNPNMIHQGPEDASPLPDQTSAWSVGMLSNPLADVSFNCSSGNCTFSTQYSTVGFCTQCTDISDTLTFNADLTSTVNITSSIPGGLSISYNPSNTNATGWDVFGMGLNNKKGAFEIILARSNWPDSNQTLDPGSGNSASVGCSNNSASTASWDCGYGAASCYVGQCIRTYEASIQAGQITENLVNSTPPLSGWGTSAVDNLEMNTIVDTHCISQDEINGLTRIGYDTAQQNRWLPFNLTLPQGYSTNSTQSIPSNATFPLSMFAKGCVYMIPYIFTKGFYEYFLSSFLNGTVQVNRGAGSPASGYSGPQVLQRLYNYGDTNFTWIDSIMRNGSTALTNQIRQTGVTNFSTPATGVVSHFATCVQIQWYWISLPAISGGLALILLVLSIGYASVDEVPIWKSSPLALIFHTEQQGQLLSEHDADAEVFQDPNLIPSTISGMRETAEKMTVKLESTDLKPVIRWRKAGKDTDSV